MNRIILPIILLSCTFMTKGTVPWLKDASKISTGGNNIVYDPKLYSRIELDYILPYQLKELSVRKLSASLPFEGTYLIADIKQSGDESLMETIFSFGAGRMLSEKILLKVEGMIYNLGSANGEKGISVLANILFIFQPTEKIILGSCVFNPTGSTIKNKTRDYHIIQAFYTGCTYLPTKNVRLIFESEKTVKERFIMHAGLDYCILQNFSIRIGLSDSPAMPSWGIGARLKKVSISYGGNYHPILGISSGFSVEYFLK